MQATDFSMATGFRVRKREETLKVPLCQIPLSSNADLPEGITDLHNATGDYQESNIRRLQGTDLRVDGTHECARKIIATCTLERYDAICLAPEPCRVDLNASGDISLQLATLLNP